MIARAHRPLFAPDRSLALSLVIGAHAVGIYLISTGDFIRPVAVDAELPPLQASIPVDDATRVPQPAPPRPGAGVQRVAAPDVPSPNLTFVPELGDPSPRLVLDFGDGRPVVPEAPPVPSTPLTWTATRATREFYPPVSLRLGEEGAAIVRTCVGTQGIPIGTPQVTTRSGHPRLDAAAVAWVREAVSFRAATENGSPVAACKNFRVTFTLTR